MAAPLEVLLAEPRNAAPSPADLAADAVTPTERFFIRDHGPVPAVDGTITVGGMVERELALTLQELRSTFPAASVTATLQCAGNRRTELAAYRPIPGEIPWGPTAIGTAVWGGVRLRDVLEHAGIADAAAHVAFTSSDDTPKGPFGASIPIDKALGDEVLLATEMNGAPLPPEHGGPLRVVVPGYIGARSVKWLTAITVQADPSASPYQTGYSVPGADGEPVVLGPVPVNSIILAPLGGVVDASDGVTIRGIAVTGNGSGIASVEVSSDDGNTWHAATLEGEDLPWAWRTWRATIPARPGEAVLVCRARDGAGRSQPADVAEVWNPKGYANNAWHRVRVTAR